jgi:hypothetical protein
MALIIKAECTVPPLSCTKSVFRDDDHPNRDARFQEPQFSDNFARWGLYYAKVYTYTTSAHAVAPLTATRPPSMKARHLRSVVPTMSGSATRREWSEIHWERWSVPGGIGIKRICVGFHEAVVLISSILTHGDLPDDGGRARQRRSGCRRHTLFSVGVSSPSSLRSRSYFLGASCQKRVLWFWLREGKVTGGRESSLLVFQMRETRAGSGRGAREVFRFFRGRKPEQDLGWKPEHGSGQKICYSYRREKTTGL